MLVTRGRHASPAARPGLKPGLTLARQGNGARDLEAVELADSVDACWQHVATAGATVAIETNRTILADRSRVKQLLENLMRNAIEHGGDDVSITVGDVADGGEFYVADDGVGIPDSELDHVFSVGYPTIEGGTGFGLAIVQDVVEAHDWEIRVTESEAGGARFEITDVDAG